MKQARPWMRRSVRCSFLLLAAIPTISKAQCPDGAPPPCKGAMPATLRKVNPPLDTRTWIVVPFANVMKASELDWLRDASVNLLSLDLGRWTDIRVVPDKRVGDLMRELMTSRAEGALTLNDGLSIARRAGAGKLVMGDFFKVGSGARFVANVFDVRTGAKLRAAVQQAPGQDSLLTAFTPLARAVLAVPPPEDARMGDLGTARLDAYQEYLLGVKAQNRDDMLEARTHLERALMLDSTFALAHFQLSSVLAWGEADAVGGQSRQHAVAAARLGRGLPLRERALIDAQVAYASADYTKSCDILRPLADKDTTDIQVLVGLGECSYHNFEVAVSPTDSMTGRYKGDWNLALRSFNRVLQLDPSYHVAFEHVLDILRVPSRGGCSRRSTSEPCRTWSSAILRSGDTLELVPVPSGSDAYYAQVTRSEKESPVVRNLSKSKQLALEWLAYDTTSERAHGAVARVLLAQGDIPGAYAHFSRTSLRATRDNAVNLRNRIDVGIKLGHGAESRMLFDSLIKSVPDAPGLLNFRAGIDLAFGHFKRWDTSVAALTANNGAAAAAYWRQLVRALAGVPSPDLDQLAWAAYTATRDTACNRDCRLGRLLGSHAYDADLQNRSWPADVKPPFDDSRIHLAYAMSVRDTAEIRKWALHLEQRSRRNITMGWPEFGWSMTSVNGFLELRDTVSALRVIRFSVDSAMGPLPITTAVATLGRGAGLLAVPIWLRMMLTRADLAAATGSRDEAKVWYDRVLDLWSTADAELQPVVERVKKSRAALGK